MTFNLIREPWLPVRTRGGGRRLIRPAEIGAGAQVQPQEEPVAFDYPRPDLETAAYELLIGLLSVAYSYSSEKDWRERYRQPPSVAELDKAFGPVAHAFDLTGDGPRFMQEFGGLEGAPNAIDTLFIDAPGGNAEKKNSDLLTHRGRYGAVSRAAAAMVVYTMQSAAPTGGAGIRTSLRGGGPLTLLAIPGGDDTDEPVSLWRQLWANVVPLSAIDESADPAPSADARVFPWLSPSLLGETLQPSDPRVHPWQVFFGAPRRLWLVLGDKPIRCPILGHEDPQPVIGVVQKPRGADYGSWRHPMTPYRRQKEADVPYSAKPKSGRFGYRDWVAGVLGDPAGKLQMPALSIVASMQPGRRSTFGQRARVRAAGWAMNNMEAREYLLAEEPLHLAENEAVAEALVGLARRWSASGDFAHSILRQALKAALFGEGSKVSTDKGVFESARIQFFDRTEPIFHDLLEQASRLPDVSKLLTEEEDLGRRWLRAMSRTADITFEQRAPLPIDDPVAARPNVEALSRMRFAFSGRGKAGATLFGHIGLTLPPAKKPIESEEVS